MSSMDSLLQGIVDNSRDEARWLVLADWLEEHGDPRRAELIRLHRYLLATCCEPDRHPERGGQQARIVELLCEGVRPCMPQKTIVLGEGVELTFVFIPPSSFLMGSPRDEEGRRPTEVRRRVTLTNSFYLGIHAVTQAQWQAVMEANPSAFPGGHRPAECVSWKDSQKFCSTLAKKTGRRFRLATEAEWEYACRAGTATPFFHGETISTEQANFDGNLVYGPGTAGVHRHKPMPVGSFPPNAWGLFDMHGNIQAWCEDWYGPYPTGDLTDPRGPESGAGRVLRGGSWNYDPKQCRSAYRRSLTPGVRWATAGCRVVLCTD
jgi:uncharacterized protein (TIGR02996 family)